MNKNFKIYALIGLTIVSAILLYDCYCKKEEISQYKADVKEYKTQIKNYEKNEILLKEDKLFYKDLYIKLADDYNSKLKELNIDEYILTDTSR